MVTTRREFVRGAGAAMTAGAVGIPAVARAQAKKAASFEAVKIGVLTIAPASRRPVHASSAAPRGRRMASTRPAASSGARCTS